MPLLGETVLTNPSPSNMLPGVLDMHFAAYNCSSKSPWTAGYLMLPAAEGWPSIPLMLNRLRSMIFEVRPFGASGCIRPRWLRLHFTSCHKIELPVVPICQ